MPLARWLPAAALCLSAMPAQAASFATLLMAAVQGAILLSRAAGDMAPFDTVAEQLQQQAAQFAA